MTCVSRLGVPETRFSAPGIRSGLPDTQIDLPGTRIDPPDIEIGALNSRIDLPDTQTDLPDILVDLPDIEIGTLNALIPLPRALVQVSGVLLLFLCALPIPAAGAQEGGTGASEDQETSTAHPVPPIKDQETSTAHPVPPIPPIALSLHGDVKTFFIAGAPFQWFGLSEAAAADLEASGLSEEEALALYGLAATPFGQGIADGRLKLNARWGESLRLDVHWAITGQSGQQTAIVPGMDSGVGLTAPEAVPLTWVPDTGAGMTLQHRIDRLVLSAKLPQVDVTLGRQPITFGTGYFFTPLDLVNPFHPATIDTEYKPGVDALRIDGYLGTSSKLTLAAAYAGDAPLIGTNRRDTEQPILNDLVLAMLAQSTVGITDLIGFLGAIHGEPVVGLGALSAIGPVGLHGEGTLTVPSQADEAASEEVTKPFIRAVLGADWRPTATTSLMGEVYLQTLGASSPAGYLEVLDDARFTRGEVWQMGQAYAALSLTQEISPLITGNVALVGNVRDPSALVIAGGSWSVADNATVGFGAYLGAGARPDEVDLEVTLDPQTMAPVLVPPTADTLGQSINSEFGLYPTLFFLQVRTYF